MRLEIPGDPIPWKRPAEGHSGNKYWRFDSQKAEKEWVRGRLKYVMRNAPENPQEGHFFDPRETYDVWLYFYLPLNSSDPTGLCNAKLWGIEPANEKPDCDNLAKFYLDAANGLLWSDDKRIRELHVIKSYSEKPRTIIEIMTKNNLKVTPSVEGVMRVFGPAKLKEFVSHVEKFSYLVKEKPDDPLAGFARTGVGNEDKEVWLSWTAAKLVEFALAHAQELKNISKFAAISEEIKPLNLEGPYGRK